MPWNNEHMLTDADGNLIPQVWDPSQNKFVPYEAKVQLSGTFVRLSTQPKPPGKEGDTLLLYDTKQVFVHDGIDWREW